jgi:hypothetical protein
MDKVKRIYVKKATPVLSDGNQVAVDAGSYQAEDVTEPLE